MNQLRIAIAGSILAITLAACGGPAEAPPATAEAPAPPAASEALAALFGTWALSPAQCSSQVLRISQTRFEGAENGCDITGYADNGDTTFTASMNCTGEGQTVSESIKMRPIYTPTGAGIELTYLDRDNMQTTVLRCPEPAATAATP